MRLPIAAAVLSACALASPALAGPIATDPLAFLTQSRTITSGANSITIDSAAYRPGVVIGRGVPTSPTLWTYAFQVFDNGIVFDRVRLFASFGFPANSAGYGVSDTLGQSGGVMPSAVHFNDGVIYSGLFPQPDFSPPLAANAYAIAFFYTNSGGPTFGGDLYLGSGAEPWPPGAATVLSDFNAFICPVPAPPTLAWLAGVAALGAQRRRSRKLCPSSPRPSRGVQ